MYVCGGMCRYDHDLRVTYVPTDAETQEKEFLSSAGASK